MAECECEGEVDELKVRVARDEELEKLKQEIGTQRQDEIRGVVIGVASPLRRRDPRLLTRPMLDRESARCVAAGSR